jgi:immune inhibitor A
MRHACNCRCIMPASPELQEKIIRTRQALAEMKSGGKSMTQFRPTEDMLDLDAYFTIINRPAKTFPDTLVSPTSEFAPVLGVRKALVLLVDFPDSQAYQTKEHFSDMLFSQGTYYQGSMRDYYKEVSYGQVDVQGEVFGWYRAPQPKSYYTNNEHGFGTYPKNAQKLVEDVLDLADKDVNFDPYDNLGDGTVQALIIIAAGSGGEQTGNKNDIWSHKWDIEPRTVDNKKVEKYFMAPEDGRVGVMAHELGHLLMSWPDLYDVDYSSRGTGNWDLMAGGSWNNYGNTPAHPSAWCKLQAGWINPTVVTNEEQEVEIEPYHQKGDVYKLSVNGDPDSKEYFLLSNRKNEGYDNYLPGEGLIIEHIDDNQSNNSDENHYLVDIEQADGQRNLNLNYNSGDYSDAFPTDTNDAFHTTNSKTYADADSTVAVTEIKKSGDNITAKVIAGKVAPARWEKDVLITKVYANSLEKANYIAVNGAEDLKKINKEKGESDSALFNALCQAHVNHLKVDLLVDDKKVFAIKLTTAGSPNGASEQAKADVILSAPLPSDTSNI